MKYSFKLELNQFLIAFCYAYRKKNDCQAKDGNPFGPYWNKFGIGNKSFNNLKTRIKLNFVF